MNQHHINNDSATTQATPDPATAKQETSKADAGALGTLEGTLLLVGDTIEQAASRVHELHRAISDMPFKAVDTATVSVSKPIEIAHNEITDLVYDAVKEVGKGVFTGAAWVVRQANQSLASPTVIDQALDGELTHATELTDLTGEIDESHLPAVPPVDVTTRRLAAVSSAINGLLGDHLTATRNPIEVKMGFYVNGRMVGLEQDELKRAFPKAQSHLVVFIHGLCCNEDHWRLYHNPEDPQTAPYGDRLEFNFPVSALYLRYNTGRNIENNARQFKRILNRLLKNWPVPVTGITFIGHSMGGLLSRALVEQVEADDVILNQGLRDVICLGSPHAGAPLAKLAQAGEQFLSQFELSKPIGRVLGIRSRGIRDLSEGLGPIKAQDGHTVQFHLIGATVGKSTGSWLNNTIGDGLVTMRSALADESGRAQTLAYANKHHMNLLNDAEVYQQVEAVIRQHLKPKIARR